MARKTPAEAASTRRRILESAAEIFPLVGITNTTLEQIAQRAGVTRGAIYWHFKGKQDLLQTLLDEQKLPLENSLSNGSDFISGWQQLQKALIETVSNKAPRRMSEIMFYQGAGTTDSALPQRRLMKVRDFFMCQFQSLLNRAIETKELPSTLNVQAATDFFKICISGLLYELLQSSDEHIGAINSAFATLLHVVVNPPMHLSQTNN